MELLFSTIGKKLYQDQGHKGYSIEWNLISHLCKKWSRNRDSEQGRVEEMVDFYDKGGYIPMIIHLAETEEEGLICYDGNHRRKVLDILYERNKNVQLTCIIDVIFNASQKEVYNAFDNLNKAVMVPALYLENTLDDTKVRNDILKLVKHYETNYKGCLSTSPRCRAPNFNRDRFTDNLHHIYLSFNKIMSVEQIKELLDKLNREYANQNICKPHTAYNQKTIDKCKKHNLYLFLERDIPFDHLTQVAL